MAASRFAAKGLTFCAVNVPAASSRYIPATSKWAPMGGPGAGGDGGEGGCGLPGTHLPFFQTQLLSPGCDVHPASFL